MKTKSLMTVTACLVLLSASVSMAGSKRYVGIQVPAASRVSINDIDHSAWQQLLSRYVDERGGVNYRAWHASTGDVTLLDQYIEELSRASLTQSSTRGAQLAYFINAYNAVTVRGILQEYPTSSIRNHTAKVIGYNIWHDLLLQVDGRAMSLDSIEHKMLRKMQEPRIHFAIVCASISCPRLLNEAYTADRLEQQLTTNTRDFFAQPGNFRYDAGRKRFQLSAILDWFGSDFGANNAEVLRAIASYLPDAASAAAARTGRGKVSYLDYDWGLNEAAKSAATGAGGSARRGAGG